MSHALFDTILENTNDALTLYAMRHRLDKRIEQVVRSSCCGCRDTISASEQPHTGDQNKIETATPSNK